METNTGEQLTPRIKNIKEIGTPTYSGLANNNQFKIGSFNLDHSF
jgi:hypothetical protein